jgi:hypothetical protein
MADGVKFITVSTRDVGEMFVLGKRKRNRDEGGPLTL